MNKIDWETISEISLKKNMLSVVLALLTICTGCSTYRAVVLSEKRPFKNSHQDVVAFTEPQYSVVAFRPHPTDHTFSKKKDHRQRAEVNKVITFLGGAITTDCPVFTIEDEPGYVESAVEIGQKSTITKVDQSPIRYENEIGTVFFDRRPESRKEPYGVIISDGVEAPRVYWGTKNYLKKVKQQFGIKTYTDFKGKLNKGSATEEAATATAEKPSVINTQDNTIPVSVCSGNMKPLTQSVSAIFARSFLHWESNARWMFHCYGNKGIRKKITRSFAGETDGSVTITGESYDRYGFPKHKAIDPLAADKTAALTYTRSNDSLVTEEIHYTRDNDGFIDETERFYYGYYPDKVIKYIQKDSLWQPYMVYFLDEGQRIFRYAGVSANGNEFEYNVHIDYDQVGNPIRIETQSSDAHTIDFLSYDDQNRLVSATYGWPAYETVEDHSMEVTTRYFDMENRSETLTITSPSSENRKVSTSTFYYDEEGQVTRAEYENGLIIVCEYTYWD